MQGLSIEGHSVSVNEYAIVIDAWDKAAIISVVKFRIHESTRKVLTSSDNPPVSKVRYFFPAKSFNCKLFLLRGSSNSTENELSLEKQKNATKFRTVSK